MRDEWTRVEAEEHEATATIARCGCGCGTRYRQASPIAPHTHLLARLVSQVGRRRRCPRWAQQVALAVEEVSKPLATLDRRLGRALSHCEQYPLSRAYFAVPALSQRQLDRVFLLSVQCPQKSHCTSTYQHSLCREAGTRLGLGSLSCVTSSRRRSFLPCARLLSTPDVVRSHRLQIARVAPYSRRHGRPSSVSKLQLGDALTTR